MNVAPIVIAGGGQAGFQVAVSLRDAGCSDDIFLIGEEPEPPYRRPMLSKAYLAGTADRTDLWLRPETYFTEHRISRVVDQVCSIDRPSRRVFTCGGKEIEYSHLVLAVGARARRIDCPGAEMAGVAYLRTLADADRLRVRMATARNVVVIGAGFIGLEVASMARARGCAVTVVEMAARAAQRTTSVAMGEFLTKAHRAAGIGFLFGDGPIRFEGDGNEITSVTLAGGRGQPADLALVGIGVLPNVEVAEAAGLIVDNGIVVDAQLRSSDPSISAIGDCARFPKARGNGYLRLESVQNATDQARAVAARLMGRPSDYKATPWFWSDQGMLKLQTVGLADDANEMVQVGASSAEGFTILHFHDGRFIASESINQPSAFMAARRILESDGYLNIEQARRSDFDLRSAAKQMIAR